MNRTIRRATPERLVLPFVAACLMLALAFAAPATAQMTRGAVSGTVRDATGAIVPGATVTMINMATNQSRTAVSDAQGFFRVGGLEPGRYTVRTELSGFSTVENRDIPVRTASEVSLSVELKVGGTTEAITVVAKSEAVELDKTTPTIGLTSTARQAVELPLSAGRQINNLILLTPNTVNVTAANNGNTNIGQGSYVINGQRSRNNNYMIDGSDNNDISVTIATSQIVPEAVAEFQVQTNAYSVEFGRNSGGQINLITKSGTNRFHGEAWEYYTTSEPLLPHQHREGYATSTNPPRYKRNQFGMDIGGPIVKDKLFFFGLYQHDMLRPGERPGLTTRIPTQAGFNALRNVPIGAGQTAASRQAVLDRISSCRTSTARA